jgi:hypothetical protein
VAALRQSKHLWLMRRQLLSWPTCLVHLSESSSKTTGCSAMQCRRQAVTEAGLSTRERCEIDIRGAAEKLLCHGYMVTTYIKCGERFWWNEQQCSKQETTLGSRKTLSRKGNELRSRYKESKIHICNMRHQRPLHIRQVSMGFTKKVL